MKTVTKQALTLFLSLIMILSTIPMVGAVEEHVSIEVSSNPVIVGNEITFTVSISGTEKAKSVGVDVKFGDKFEFVSAEWLKSDGFMSNYDSGTNKGIFAYTSSSDMNGQLFKLTLKAKTADEAAQPVSINLQMKDGSTVILNETATENVSIVEKPKLNFTGITISNATYTYDGTEKNIAISGTLPTGATVSYENNKATNAGEYDVKATVKADGYNDLVLIAKLSITPKNLTVSGLKAENKIYDSTTDAVISGGSLNGVISGDDITATFPKTGKFAKADVGNGIVVSTDAVSIDGGDKNNYTLTQPAALKANITAAPLKIKADDLTIVKGSKVPELTYTITEGKLFVEDKLTGSLTTTANGTKLGTFDITQGTLKASTNYKLTFTKGTITVVDKTVQNIVVSEITDKTYGDEPFKITVTPDGTSGLTEFTFTSGNPDVAEIDAAGNVTIKSAGKTDITVKQAGNDDYAAFEKKQTLIVNKVAIVVTADAKTKRIGTDDPELTYTYTGKLVGEDSFTGALARKTGEQIGKYDILQGTLALNANYELTYNKAVFEIVDKAPQNITVSAIEEKTYGDAAFKVEVTPDSEASLSDFTFESDNTGVAEIDAEGNVTIKAAGEANITVKQAGNDDYAAFSNTQKLVVGKKKVAVTEIKLGEKTASITGLLDTDTAVVIDFNKATFEILEQLDDTTSKVNVTSFVLAGEKSENYEVETAALESSIATSEIVTVGITATNGTVIGAGNYIKGSSVTVTATPDSRYKFSGWYVEKTVVSSESAYTFTADESVELTAKFTSKSTGVSTGGAAGTVYYTVQFETDGGTTVSSKKVEKNEKLAEPETPVKEGFVFDGWYTDAEFATKYDFTSTVTSDFVLYAKWTESEKEPEAEKSDDKEPETAEWKNPFGDVKDNDWFYENVKYVVENKLMSGVAENEFAPNEALTRAMLVTVLYRNAGEPAVNKSIPFADVDMGAYYADAVVWAQQNGIVNGVTENEFAPDENITREQIAAIVYRYAKYKGYDVSVGESTNILSYDDAESISDYAVASMQYVVGGGLIKGKTDTTLNPQDNATRAEIAAILQRFIETNK